jgi:predicted RNA-binding protein YlqC (UPF0109 family)
MFEEPDFSRAQPQPADEDVFEEDADLEDDDDVEDLEDEAGDAGDDLEDDLDEDDDDEDEEDEELEEEEELAGEDSGAVLDEVDETVNRVRGGAAKAVLEHVARMLVDDPDSVIVDVSEGRSGWRFSVHVAQGDMGRLIGRKGRTAQAIRTLVRAAAASEGTEASVDIVD